MMLNYNALLQEKIDEQIKENVSNITIDNTKLNDVWSKLQPYLTMSKAEFVAYTKNALHNNDPYVVYTYMKSYTRQNIYEDLQLKVLGSYLDIADIERHCRISLCDTKTVDGYSKSTNAIFNCKYIKESGGSQDNQFNDLIKFNQPSEYSANYLVISGKYGISKMEKYLETNTLEDNVKVAFLGDNVIVVDKKTQSTIHYSKNKVLIKNLLPIPEGVGIVEPFVELAKPIQAFFISIREHWKSNCTDIFALLKILCKILIGLFCFIICIF